MGKYILRQRDGSVTSTTHNKSKIELMRLLKLRRSKGEKGWRLVKNPKHKD